ncbi:MAG: SRPBCC domain-containing protein [Proteobacteria bacterium]|nr:SRPBCC domain-containing protein [Pseudomonadota bacterium]
MKFPPNKVYAAFSDPLLLTGWWGPKDFKNTFEVFEFKTNGIWKFIMHGPDGHNYQNENLFIELIPAEKIAIRHISQPNFTLTVTLSPNDAGTQLVWAQEFDDPKFAESVRHIVEPSNEQNLDRLEMVLAGELN